MQHAPPKTILLTRLLARLLAPLLVIAAATAPAAADDAPEPGDIPLYPEELEGESILWLDVGGYNHWFTDRGPMGEGTPLVLGLGFAYRIGPARLAWGVHVYEALPDDRPMRFLHIDLVGVEYLFTEDWLRPWLRGGLGVGFDLIDSELDITNYGNPTLGDDAYFTYENGTSAGVTINASAGVDVWFDHHWFVRAEAGFKAFSGVGRPALVFVGHLGPGYGW